MNGEKGVNALDKLEKNIRHYRFMDFMYIVMRPCSVAATGFMLLYAIYNAIEKFKELGALDLRSWLSILIILLVVAYELVVFSALITASEIIEEKLHCAVSERSHYDII